MKTIMPAKTYKAPTVAIICPACDSQVGFDEIVEREGRISCINCA